MVFLNFSLLVLNNSLLNESDCTITALSPLWPISSDKLANVLLVILFSALSAFSIFANAIVLLALVTPQIIRKLGKQNASKGESTITVMLMAAMAFADFGLGVIVLPQAIAEIAENPHDIVASRLTKIRGSLNVFWCTVSMYNMTSLAMDRYIASCKPFFYRSMLTRSRYVLFGLYIAAPLLISTITLANGFRLISPYNGYPCHYQSHSVQAQVLFILNVSISLYIPMSAMLVLYYKVFRQINRFRKIFPVSDQRSYVRVESVLQEIDHVKTDIQITVNNEVKTASDSRFQPKNNSSVNTTLNIVCNTSPNVYTLDIVKAKAKPVWKNTERHFAATSFTTNNDNEAQNTRADVEKKNNSQRITSGRIKEERTLSVVVLCFIVCWLPLSVATSVSFSTVTPLPSWAIVLVSWMGYGNSALNPVLFCCHREVWQYVKQFLHIK